MQRVNEPVAGFFSFLFVESISNFPKKTCVLRLWWFHTTLLEVLPSPTVCLCVELVKEKKKKLNADDAQRGIFRFALTVPKIFRDYLRPQLCRLHDRSKNKKKLKYFLFFLFFFDLCPHLKKKKQNPSPFSGKQFSLISVVYQFLFRNYFLLCLRPGALFVIAVVVVASRRANGTWSNAFASLP